MGRLPRAKSCTKDQASPSGTRFSSFTNQKYTWVPTRISTRYGPLPPRHCRFNPTILAGSTVPFSGYNHCTSWQSTAVALSKASWSSVDVPSRKTGSPLKTGGGSISEGPSSPPALPPPDAPASPALPPSLGSSSASVATTCTSPRLPPSPIVP